MRECEAQGGEGVWNSWPSGGASCSFALQPLASWDTTEMSGWGGAVQYLRRVADGRGDGFSLFRVGGLEWCGAGGWGGAVWPTWPMLEENWEWGGEGWVVRGIYCLVQFCYDFFSWFLQSGNNLLEVIEIEILFDLRKDGCWLWFHGGSLVSTVHDFAANVCTHVEGEPHPHVFMFCAQDTENYRERTLVASISSSVRDMWLKGEERMKEG